MGNMIEMRGPVDLAIERARDAADVMHSVTLRTLEADFERSFHRGHEASVWVPAWQPTAMKLADVLFEMNEEHNTVEGLREIVAKAALGFDVQQMASEFIAKTAKAHADIHAESGSRA